MLGVRSAAVSYYEEPEEYAQVIKGSATTRKQKEETSRITQSLWSYLEVLKPRETILLTFIGTCAAIIAGGGHPPFNTLLLASATVALGSAGCNGLTNYLDREVDARMQRTRDRAIPSGMIHPAEKTLPLTGGLTAIALILAWVLHPLCFVSGLVGVIAAVVARKRWITHILGGISGSAPVLVGWFAVNPVFNWTILLLVILILVWVPIHVWSLMTAYRDDYLQAGVNMFPVSHCTLTVTRMLLALSVILFGVSLLLGHLASLSKLYIAVAIIIGLTMIWVNWKLLGTDAKKTAWRVYKLSAYPYLGIIFLTICVDLWL